VGALSNLGNRYSGGNASGSSAGGGSGVRREDASRHRIICQNAWDEIHKIGWDPDSKESIIKALDQTGKFFEDEKEYQAFRKEAGKEILDCVHRIAYCEEAKASVRAVARGILNQYRPGCGA